MKRALLWLSTLACLTLAGLYAYAWFNRDPRVIAFEQIAVGMTMDEAAEIMGGPGEEIVRPGRRFVYVEGGQEYCGDQGMLWADDVYVLRVFARAGRVIATNLGRRQETVLDKICRWIRNPLAL